MLQKLHLPGTAASEFPRGPARSARLEGTAEPGRRPRTRRKSAGRPRQPTCSCRWKGRPLPKEPSEQAIRLPRLQECARESEQRPCVASFHCGGRCGTDDVRFRRGFRTPQKLYLDKRARESCTPSTPRRARAALAFQERLRSARHTRRETDPWSSPSTQTRSRCNHNSCDSW